MSISDVEKDELTSLFEKAKSSPIIVEDGRTRLGALVSVEDFEIIRRSYADRLLASMDALGHEMRENAARQGLTMREVAIDLGFDPDELGLDADA